MCNGLIGYGILVMLRTEMQVLGFSWSCKKRGIGVSLIIANLKKNRKRRNFSHANTYICCWKNCCCCSQLVFSVDGGYLYPHRKNITRPFEDSTSLVSLLFFMVNERNLSYSLTDWQSPRVLCCSSLSCRSSFPRRQTAPYSCSAHTTKNGPTTSYLVSLLFETFTFNLFL